MNAEAEFLRQLADVGQATAGFNATSPPPPPGLRRDANGQYAAMRMAQKCAASAQKYRRAARRKEAAG